MIASHPTAQATASHLIQAATVHSTQRLCREHHCLTIRLAMFPPAKPGQFVHLCPQDLQSTGYAVVADPWSTGHEQWLAEWRAPLLRRAFSIARLVRSSKGVEVDVIFRVVGAATRWMEQLRVGDSVSVLGPLGNHFPIHPIKPTAWLVAGGVGLPPLLWMADALNDAAKRVVAFCGAQSADLLALSLDPSIPLSRDARSATRSAREFAQANAGVVISTDDGSIGFHGHIGSALHAFAQANPVPLDEVVVYTCGPERMMRFVAEFCAARGIECYVCVERNMACGTGMCQSCVVPIHDALHPAGWRYQLCCTDGPIFDARQVVWEPDSV